MNMFNVNINWIELIKVIFAIKHVLSRILLKKLTYVFFVILFDLKQSYII